MKNSYLYGLALVLISGIAGCTKFLTKEIQGVYPADQFYQTSDQAVAAINAAYQTLNFTSATQNPLWVFGDVASDDAVKGGLAGDEPDIGLIDQFNITPINSNLLNEWGTLYEGVTRCNLVLAYVPAINMDTVLRSRILAEARFLRSWYYFTLVNIFGDVPLVLTPLTPSQMQIGQSPAALIYESVIEPDLKSAAATLPVVYNGSNSANSASNTGRATSGAATALLAKAYLFQQKWDSAIAAAQQVINSNLYSLMPVYSQNFSADYKNNAESIFEVQMLSGQVPKVGNALNQWFAPAVDNGYFFNAPTQSFVSEFEVTSAGVADPRLNYTVGIDSASWFNGETFSAAWSPTGYLTRKYQQPFSEVSISLKGDGSCDYLAIRYADVLLWYAEALNASGNPDAALVPLNAVRTRARESYLYDSTLPGYPNIPANLLPPVTYTNQADVLSSIQHERRVEFGFEFHRYFDVIRWGKAYATQVMSNSPGFNYDLNKTFPIPQTERDTDKALHP
jgi:starch-binding outer membrane protein, SusD/RagB family